MIANMISLLLVVSTTRSVMSFSDYTLDRYRERDQTIRHGKSKFKSVTLSASSSSLCFHRLANVPTSHKREEQPRLSERGMSRIRKNLKVEAISEQLRKSIRCSLKITNLRQENVFCKNINSDINWGIKMIGAVEKKRNNLSSSHCACRSLI